MTVSVPEAGGPEVLDGLMAELETFATLVRSVSSHELTSGTPFHGWPVRDVAAHVVGVFADVLGGRVENISSLETAARQAAERRSASVSELVEELESCGARLLELGATFDDAAWQADAPGGFRGTLRDAVAALTFDALTHRHDILTACGRPRSAARCSLAAATFHVLRELSLRGWGEVAFELSPLRTAQLGKQSARTVRGDALDFVLCAAGRFGDDTYELALDEPIR